MANTFLQTDALIQTFNLLVLLVIGNFTYTFHGILFLNIRFPVFRFLTILKFHEKYLNSCEGMEYVKRKLKCIFNKAKTFLEIFIESV